MGSRINAGDLRHVVTWQSFSEVNLPGKAGQSTKEWTTVGQHFAAIEPLSGIEVYNARQLKATSNYRVTMRDVGPISPKDRLLFEATGRVFNVDSVNRPEELGADLILMVTELS